MKPERITSDDGSHTLYLDSIRETYHSTKGALQESEHVFIKQGFHKALPAEGAELLILEVGFGTGLNAYLTWREAVHTGTPVRYFTLEPYPLETELVQSLNYKELVPDAFAAGAFERLHDADWKKEVRMDDCFSLNKVQTTLEQYQPPPDLAFDLVYYDAFAPSRQPELWEEDVLARTCAFMKPEASLVTYCASGAFKRNLRKAGFEVIEEEGPPGKREMTRGEKQLETFNTPSSLP